MKHLIKALILVSFFSCTKEIIDLKQESKIPIVSSPFPYCYKNTDPIGGGAGYSNIINPLTSADVHITSPISGSDFQTLVQNASQFTTIFIDPSVIVDATGLGSIFVTKEITIASDRGLNGSEGALIYTTDYNNCCSRPLFHVLSSNVRFTGLRIMGPTGLVGSPTSPKHKVAIELDRGRSGIALHNLEVDNCELFNFPQAAILLGNRGDKKIPLSKGNFIHHNYIHNNRQAGIGYGVSVDVAYTKISSNIFQNNRHDIAGSGDPACGYEASCNTVLQSEKVDHSANHHSFDMHEEGGNGATNAGKFIFIHHNDFLYTLNKNIGICGRPDIQCRIENNRFKHDGPAAAIYQACGNRSTVGAYGNMLVWNNIYNTDNYLGWYVKKTWAKNKASNFMNLYSQNSNTELNLNDFQSINGSWVEELFIEDTRIKNQRTPNGTPSGKINTPNYSFNFGDYNGDGNTDVFKLEDGSLYTIPYDASTYGYNTDWKLIATTGYKMKDLRFGFFDGDNKTDMIVKAAGNIYLSSGCNTTWQIILSTGYDFTDFHFGDFLGDGQTDIFLADGASFMFSNDAQTGWSQMASSGSSPDNLLLGFFNTNTKSDVFVATGANFLISFEGINSWTTFATSSYTVPNNKLQSADFNGDNISDILNDYHQVSLGGINNWSPTTTTTYPISTFPYGNF